jgi:S1-C subfamily serine protease
MLVVDVIVVIALVVAFATGVARGFFATVGTIAGLVVGALAALWWVPLLTPVLSDLLPEGIWRTIGILAVVVAIVALFTALGTAIGAAIRKGVERTRLRGVERFLGGIVNLVATALVVLVLAAGATASGVPVVSSAVASSQVVQTLDRLSPEPLDDALSSIRALVVDDGLPRLREVIGTVVTPTDPPVALDDPDLQRASASVARISGTAYACGVSMTGSGFLAAPGLVVTNAHVVAGVDAPLVQLPEGDAREGRVVYIDPVDDLAVIAVSGLEATPLAIAEPVSAGTQTAVQGYPRGGPFTSSTAGVIAVGPVPVPDIYDRSTALRDVYTLDADVQPGNSGGPLLDAQGDVVGVVFARGAEGERRGYAMTTDELAPVLQDVDGDSPTVASGACTR